MPDAIPRDFFPCPFCGGRASLSEGRNGDGTVFTYIECDECGATAETKWWNKRTCGPMPELTPDRLREIEARCENASPPPWHKCEASKPCCPCHLIWSRTADAVVCQFHSMKDEDDNEGFTEEQALKNSVFIENSRQDIPDLLAALKQVREERDQFALALVTARKALEFYKNAHNWKIRKWGAIQYPSRVNEDRGQTATSALVNIADPAECMKVRDAEITAKALQHWQAAYRKYVQQEGTK